ncbi:phospholipase [Xenorhabdus bovienii]|uniref:phospholipase n=1 Tax=Xenorhabdus bovienii TaxID=40576 RepID=UPI003DA6000C
MTLSINSSFFSELGIYSLQGSPLQLQSGPPAKSPSDKADVTHSTTQPTTVPLSENTQQNNNLYQSLVRDRHLSAMALPELHANDIAGKHSKRIDYDLSLVTRDVYRMNSMGIGDYVRLTKDEISKAGIDPAILEDSSTGFQAGVYRNKGLYIVSFTGSNEIQDFMASIRQGLGFKEEQYGQAVKLAQAALKGFGENVIFTGHSMGGGLASVAALTTGKPAVIFNAAGVSDSTLKSMGLSPKASREVAENGLIRNYIVEHDWLDNLQKTLPIPQPMGNKILLEYEYEPEGILDSIFAYRYAFHSFKAHFMEAVQELLTVHKPWLNKAGEMIAATEDSMQNKAIPMQKQALNTWGVNMDEAKISEQLREERHQLVSQQLEKHYSV